MRRQMQIFAADSAALRFARETFERRGSGQRTNRNMVVFLAPDTKRLEELAEATRDYLAWDWIAGRVEELNLSPQQVRQVESNRSRSDEAVTARIAQTYHWVLVPEQPDPARPPVIAVEKADGAIERLADRVSEKLTRSGLLAGVIAARTIRLDLDQRLAAVWARGYISVGELWAYYCRYPYLTRVRDRAVFEDGVRSTLTSFTWELDGFALAQTYDTSGRYQGLVLPGPSAHFGQVTDATLLVAPAAAQAQATAMSARPSDVAAEGSAGPEVVPGGAAGGASAGRVDEAGEAGEVARPANTRFFGVYQVDPERYGRDLTRLSQEILQQLATVDGARLEVTIEVHAHKDDGFPDDKVRIVLENARTLRFRQFGFESD